MTIGVDFDEAANCVIPAKGGDHSNAHQTVCGSSCNCRDIYRV